MKVLYLSCHSILEYDEVSLFKEMGIDVFSHGSYRNPIKVDDPMRPRLNWESDQELCQMSLNNPKENMSREFIEKFDVIISMWNPGWIIGNWGKMKDKIVIMRTIGQSTPGNELEMKPYKDQGMKIVRYSPMEKNIPNYCGEDAMIRFYKDENEWRGWTGIIKQIITVGQSMKTRGSFCHYDLFDQATSGLPRKVFGPGNQNIEDWGGFLTIYELHKAYQDNQVYFFTGTLPSSYTLNFIEAWMTGIPIVAIGKKYGNPGFVEQDTYEIPELIENGVNGFYSDDIEELKSLSKKLLDDWDLCKKIGEEGRKKAIEYFGKEKIKKEWEDFFKSLGVM